MKEQTSLGDEIRNLRKYTCDMHNDPERDYTRAECPLCVEDAATKVDILVASKSALEAEIARLREALQSMLASPEELFIPRTGERALFVPKEVEAKARAALEPKS